MSRKELRFGKAKPKRISSDGMFYENGKEIGKGYWEKPDLFIIKVSKRKTFLLQKALSELVSVVFGNFLYFCNEATVVSRKVIQNQVFTTIFDCYVVR